MVPGGPDKPTVGVGFRSVIDPFVEVGWLLEHRDEVIVADVRFYLDGRSGRDAHMQGHIPGAVYIDLQTALSAPRADNRTGRHPLPTPERFAGELARLGIGDTDTVVAYDDAGGVVAARLVWMLRATGHEAALLNGGLSAWPKDQISTAKPASSSGGGSVPCEIKRFTPVAWPRHLLATIDELPTTTAVMIDARDSARFAGGPDPVDPRSGHIPGAVSVPARGHLGADDRIADPLTVRATFANVGVGPETEVISYCGSGVTACHNLLALEHAGLGRGRLYPGSWSEWSRDPARPIATGPEPE